MAQELALCWDSDERMVSGLSARDGHRRFRLRTGMAHAAHPVFFKVAHYQNHCHMVAIYHAYYNFCRVHQMLCVTPAMEAGLADHVWSFEELVGLLELRTENRAA
jgi:hypothetical protein